jgi:endonuclease/exonuclease/phosphatase family metal-dependent hydrolase
VLHAAVEPWPGRPLLHVCVTHFSLSAAARKIAASCIVEWTNNQDHQNVVLMGDLNAEPHEESLQLLREGGFRDAWADLHGRESVAAKSLEAGLGLVNTKLTQAMETEDLPCVDGRKHCRRARHMQTSGGESVASFTFPTCNPVKRIDYVLFRGNLRPLSGQLCGAEPKEGGQHHRTPGGGMLERNGPVYASDHLGVLIHFQPTSESFSPIIS